jgi:hypothetical protein
MVRCVAVSGGETPIGWGAEAECCHPLQLGERSGPVGVEVVIDPDEVVPPDRYGRFEGIRPSA